MPTALAIAAHGRRLPAGPRRRRAALAVLALAALQAGCGGGR